MIKRIFLIAIAAVIALSLVAFGGSSEETQAPTAKDHAAERAALQEYLSNHTSSDVYACLADDANILVLVSHSGASVSARVVLPQNIPFVAEELCSILAAATADLDIEISKLTVNSYSKNNAGDVSNMVDWHTYDLQTGILTHEADGVAGGGYTVDKLYEYFNLEPGKYIG